jgi:acyl carrier protein
MKMEKKDFIIALVDYCEFPQQEIDGRTLLNSIEGYDSLAVMAIIAFTHEKFGRRINAVQIQNLTDVDSLINLVGLELPEK